MAHGEYYINLRSTKTSSQHEAFLRFCYFCNTFNFSKSELKNKLNAFSIFLILYSLSRFFIEFFREPDSN